jgi:hypothetical protein
MIELVLILHFLIILFVIFGFPVGLKYNHRLFRIIHFSSLVFVAVLMVLGLPCPLTILEEYLRQAPVYEGSFIASWLNRIIYLEGFDARFVVYLASGFAVLVGTSFFWRPLNPEK